MTKMKKWISSTPLIQAGVDVINAVDCKKFQLFLNRITQDIISNPDSNRPFTHDQEEKLLETLSVDKYQLDHLIRTTLIILRKAVYSMASLESMEHEFLVELKMNEDKVQIFLSVWSASAKTLVLKMKQKPFYPKRLEDVSWLSNIEISSRGTREIFQPKAILQFKLNQSEVIVDLDENDLLKLFNCVEDIQESLDALTSS